MAACLNFLRAYGLEKHVKMNIETNHATLAGHTMQHELEYAAMQGFLGSIDANFGDLLLGWDTDQFAMNVPELRTLCFHELLNRGGFTTGGVNFDAKIWRQSIDPDDLIHAHVGSMDACARALLAAADMLEVGVLTAPLAERYIGWAGNEGRAILSGQRSLADLADRALARGFDPQPRSGRQEYLESSGQPVCVSEAEHDGRRSRGAAGPGLEGHRQGISARSARCTTSTCRCFRARWSA